MLLHYTLTNQRLFHIHQASNKQALDECGSVKLMPQQKKGAYAPLEVSIILGES